MIEKIEIYGDNIIITKRIEMKEYGFEEDKFFDMVLSKEELGQINKSVSEKLIEEGRTKADIKIQHSNPELSKAIREVLEEEQRKGNLTFNMEMRRKCDFCERTLTENDDFESFGGLDKCKSCIEGDK